MKVLVEIDEQRLWEEVLGSCWVGYDWWTSVRYISGDWDVIGELTIAYDDPDSDATIVDSLTLGKLAKGYAIVCEKYPHLSDLDNQDACSGDAIIQCALMGDIIYG